MAQQKDTIFPQPFYYIGFSIIGEDGSESEFRTLFLNEKGSIKHFLEHEMQGFRFGGWTLPRNVQYMIRLNGLEYQDDTKRVKILENGHIIVQGTVSESFLCWANSSIQSTLKGDRVKINTTALIEFTYNSVALLRRSLEDIKNPEKIICKFGFIGMDNNYVLDNEKLMGVKDQVIISYEMNPIGLDTESNLPIDPLDISNDDGVAKTTYLILAKVFRMFSFTEDKISYVQADEKKIDINLIKRI